MRKDTCAADLRALCVADAPPQTRTMMYAFAPGRCGDRRTQIVPTQLKEDLANFLLVRGDYAYLGHGWLGCSKFYHFPPELNADYGTPTGLCSETAAGSGVFVREWTKLDGPDGLQLVDAHDHDEVEGVVNRNYQATAARATAQAHTNVQDGHGHGGAARLTAESTGRSRASPSTARRGA